MTRLSTANSVPGEPMRSTGGPMKMLRGIVPPGLAKPLIIGLAIRELLAPITGHPFDFEIWARLGVHVFSGLNPYTLLPYSPTVSFVNTPLLTSISYPPLSALFFGAAYWLYQILGSPSAYLYYFILKQPAVVADILVAVFLYKLVSLKSDSSTARKVASAWAYFPLAIIVSSMWGALDSAALFLILAALYYFETDRTDLAAALLGLSIYLKLQPLIFLPVFLFSASMSVRKKASFSAISLSIPLLGTVIPFVVFGWGFSGIYSAVSYQGSLPLFGGFGAFNVFSLLVPPTGPLTLALSLAWIPALALGYAYAYLKKASMVEALLIVVLMFSVFRSTMPEQWAIYPIAFLMISGAGRSRNRALAISVVATAFLLVNNALLVRFFTPIVPGALAWDQLVDNASMFASSRYALMLILSTMFTAEALSAVFAKNSFLAAKLSAIMEVKPRQLRMPLAYIAVVSLSGGLLDYTATKMVADWAPAFAPGVFLGLGWLSLYHAMLVAVFEVMVVLIVLFSRRGLSDSVAFFFLLTFLNFIASALSLMLYRALDGQPVLATTTIYLLGSSLVTERTFIVFAIALGVTGIFYLKEISSALTFLARQIVQITPGARMGTRNADSLPPSA